MQAGLTKRVMTFDDIANLAATEAHKKTGSDEIFRHNELQPMKNKWLSNKPLRSIHRDFGYFFVGLIIAFCVSGIMLNHRTTWNPVRYKYDFKKVKTAFHLPKESVKIEDVKSFNTKNEIEGFNDYDFRGDSTLVIFYKTPM